MFVGCLSPIPLGGDAAALGLQVEVLDVEGQEFLGAGGGLVEHPPRDPFARAVLVVGKQFALVSYALRRRRRAAGSFPDPMALSGPPFMTVNRPVVAISHGPVTVNP